MKPLAIIMCGIPGAGKTTVRDRLLASIAPLRVDVVAPDDIIEEVAHAMGGYYNDIFFTPEAKQVCYEAGEWRLRHSVLKQHNVMIDRTHLDRKQRSKAFKKLLAHPADECIYDVIGIGVDVPTDVQTWVSRLDQRTGKAIKPATLFSMIRSYERPCESEGFTAAFHGTSDSDVAERAANFIRENYL